MRQQVQLQEAEREREGDKEKKRRGGPKHEPCPLHVSSLDRQCEWFGVG